MNSIVAELETIKKTPKKYNLVMKVCSVDGIKEKGK